MLMVFESSAKKPLPIPKNLGNFAPHSGFVATIPYCIDTKLKHLEFLPSLRMFS